MAVAIVEQPHGTSTDNFEFKYVKQAENIRTSRRKYHSFYGKGMIGTNTQWRHPEQEPWCVRHRQGERRGGQEASMVGIVDQHLITIVTCVFYNPETKAYQTSASYDLFPQHCQLPTLSDQQHNKEVAKEWIESVQRLKNKPKKAAIKDLKKQLAQ